MRKQSKKLKRKKIQCFSGRNVGLVHGSVCLVLNKQNKAKKAHFFCFSQNDTYRISLLDTLEESKPQRMKCEFPSWIRGPL